MSSIIKVDTVKDIASTDIIKKSGTSITVGTASDTTTVAGNAVRSNAIQAADGQNIISQVGTTITLGATGDTVEIATGATLVGGGIAWQSSIVTAATHTAAAGEGYWIDTTSNACTITLPASASVGDQIIFSDYLRTWGTNAVTINQNSLNFQGYTSPNPVYDTDGQSVDIVYSGATQGWIPTVDDDVTFETNQNYSSTQLVIAGGGGGATNGTAAGGAGGFRTSTESFTPGVTYTITIGTGGAGSTGTGDNGGHGYRGIDSSLSGTGITTITSAGGGGGYYGPSASPTTGGNDGGSGGGGYSAAVGSGNTPSTSPVQGFDGGAGASGSASGGGGGASQVGASTSNTVGGVGGNGSASSITGSSVTYAGGGGGGSEQPSGAAGGSGGGGVGGSAGTPSGNGGTNLGGGGGGGTYPGSGGTGGSGVVILSMADANYSGTTTGSPTVATGVSGQTVLTFNGSGSYTG
jgi:hypothetical protein